MGGPLANSARRLLARNQSAATEQSFGKLRDHLGGAGRDLTLRSEAAERESGRP